MIDNVMTAMMLMMMMMMIDVLLFDGDLCFLSLLFIAFLNSL